MNQLQKVAAALGLGLGAIGGYRSAGDDATATEKLEGLGRGVVRGGMTGIGASLGGELGRVAGDNAINNAGPNADKLRAAIQLLGMAGGGAAGYAGSGALMGPASYEHKHHRQAPQGVTTDENVSLDPESDSNLI